MSIPHPRPRAVHGACPCHPHPTFSLKEQERSEKVSRRVSAVEEVRSHVKVLREMLSMYRRPGQAPPDQEALQVGPYRHK